MKKFQEDKSTLVRPILDLVIPTVDTHRCYAEARIQYFLDICGSLSSCIKSEKPNEQISRIDKRVVLLTNLIHLTKILGEPEFSQDSELCQFSFHLLP